MKIDKAKLQEMASDIKVVLPFILRDGANPKELNETCRDIAWFRTYANRAYSQSNGNVLSVGGKRILEQKEDYELYPCGTNDKTIRTALQYIFKNML